LLHQLGLAIAGTGVSREPTLEQVLSFLGAGIYEEALFRLLLFSALVWLFRAVDFPALWAVLLSALVSAAAFAVAHNLGDHGERFNSYVFLFRTVAGLYFTLLFHLRGFGIAVGAHT